MFVDTAELTFQIFRADAGTPEAAFLQARYATRLYHGANLSAAFKETRSFAYTGLPKVLSEMNAKFYKRNALLFVCKKRFGIMMQPTLGIEHEVSYFS